MYSYTRLIICSRFILMKRYSKRRLKGLLLYANTAVLVSPTDRSTLSKAFLGVGGFYWTCSGGWAIKHVMRQRGYGWIK